MRSGVENEDVLCSEIDRKQILGGLCKIVSKVEDYGVINHMSYEPTIVFGELNNVNSKRAIKFEQTFKAAGINTVLTKNIQLPQLIRRLSTEQTIQKVIFF